MKIFKPGLATGTRAAEVRRLFWARHKGLVKRLPAAKQVVFHERTLHAIHRAVKNDPQGRKGLALILAQRRLRKRATSGR